MGNVRPSHGREQGRETYFLYGLMALVASFGMAVLTAGYVADAAFFLNVLVQTSSVMIGFAFVVAVFLIQTSVQKERELASDYLHMFLEVKKMELRGELRLKVRRVVFERTCYGN